MQTFYYTDALSTLMLRRTNKRNYIRIAGSPRTIYALLERLLEEFEFVIDLNTTSPLDPADKQSFESSTQGQRYLHRSKVFRSHRLGSLGTTKWLAFAEPDEENTLASKLISEEEGSQRIAAMWNMVYVLLARRCPVNFTRYPHFTNEVSE